MTKFFLVFFFWFSGTLSIHNFYVSTTSIRFVAEEKILQITSQVFLDDFEKVIEQYGAKKIELIPEVSQDEIDDLVEDYFRKNIIFKAQGDTLDFNFLGKVYRNDLLVTYMELKVDSSFSEFSIKNTLFYELLPDQKNIIHLKVASKRKSFLAVSSKSEFEVPKDFFDFQH